MIFEFEAMQTLEETGQTIYFSSTLHMGFVTSFHQIEGGIAVYLSGGEEYYLNYDYESFKKLYADYYTKGYTLN